MEPVLKSPASSPAIVVPAATGCAAARRAAHARAQARGARPWLARQGTIIRVVLGPQDDYFAKATIAAFLAGPWTLSTRSDRMAYLLEGERLAHAKGFNIVSDGIAFGAIQVPGDGQPVVLMA